MTNDQLKTSTDNYGNVYGLYINHCTYRVERHIRILHNLRDYDSGVQSRVAIKSDVACCLQWLLIKHLYQLLNTHYSTQIRQQMVHYARD